ncbi:MAG: Bbp16 family capsid cement protein [Verrucomicrobiota bacterium]
MIIDNELYLSKAQAVTTGATDSTNKIDLGAAGDATDCEMFLVIGVNTTATSGGSGTVAFSVQTCATIGGSYTKMVETAAIPVATLVAGYYPLRVRIPRGLLEFVKVVYTVATADLTAGKFDAFLTPEIDTAADGLA